MPSISEFLRWLYPDPILTETNSWLLVWQKDPRRISHWCNSIAGADKAAAAIGPHDAYFGVCARKRRMTTSERGSDEDISAVPGLWIDIDVAGPTHAESHKALFPDESSVQEWLRSLPAQPTITIATGGGYHCYWLFVEPWVLDGDTTRAAELVQRWQRTLIAKAPYAIDSTYDLSRVLRLPETLNYKITPPLPVHVVLQDGPRYQPSDFDQWLLDETVEKPKAFETVSYATSGEPPVDKLEALLANDSKFRKSWERKRTDLADQSASGYDLSLASLAYAAGWTEQEIVDLLYAARRKFGDDTTKLERPDYLSRLFARVKLSRERQQIRAIQEHAVDDVVTEAKDAATLPESPKLQDKLSTALGVSITSVIKYQSAIPVYYLNAGGQTICLGDVDGLITQARFRSAIAASTGTLIKTMKQYLWEDIARILLQSCEVRDTGEMSSAEGLVYSLLSGYLSDKRPTEPIEDTLSSLFPFRLAEGAVGFYLRDFAMWLKYARADASISPTALPAMLRNSGIEPRAVTITIENSRICRSVWVISPSILESLT